MARKITVQFLGDASSLKRATGQAEGTLSGVGGKLKRFGAIGAAGLAAIGAKAISLEADFGQTMATMAAVTGAPAGEMKKLNDLAIKLGADTSFSASEAAGAMLELGKAGLSTSTIMGGGVAGTLTLAAAGGTDLGTAATIASNALNTFNLRGKDMASVAAALAGGANASSASVESLGQGLQQVGPGAVNAGLSLQETVAALSAFDSAGIKGSDAGTSLKTMLARLVPQTEASATAMKKLGLNFVDADGNFKSISDVAQQLQDKLGGLSESQRAAALTTIFGSDATRAATVLMNEGSAGLAKYIKATNDQGAAQKMAEARMSGTAGALERLKGSVETAALRIGQELAPHVQRTANFLAENLVPAVESTISGFGKFAGFVKNNQTTLKALAVTIAALIVVTKVHAAVMAVQAAGGMLKYLASTKLVSGAIKVFTAVQWAMNAALAANPIGLVIVALVALGVGLVILWKKSETFRNIVKGALDAVADAGKWLWENALRPAFAGIKRGFEAVGAAFRWVWNNLLQPVFRFIIKGVESVLRFWAKMLRGLSNVPGFGWAKAAADKMDAAARKAGAIADGIKKIPNRKDVKVNVTTTYRQVGRATVPGTDIRTNVPQYARGTNFHPGGLAFVHADELIELPRGAKVHTAAATRGMIGSPQGIGSDRPIVVENRIYLDGKELHRALVKRKGVVGPMGLG